jgi:hypothetical protein
MKRTPVATRRATIASVTVFQRRRDVLERHAAQIARVTLVVVAQAAVHRAAVVPDHEIALRPCVRVDEGALRRELREVADQHERLRRRPATDAADVRREVESETAGRRVLAHETLWHRRTALLLLGREHVETELRAREDQRVLGNEVLHGVLHRLRQLFPRDARVDVLRLATRGRNHTRMQHRVFRGRRLEAAVAVPEHIAQVVHAPAVFPVEDLAVGREVRDVVDLHVGEAPTALVDERGRVFHAPELLGKAHLLLVRERLPRDHEHAVAVDERCEIDDLHGRKRHAQVEAFDACREVRVQGDRRETARGSGRLRGMSLCRHASVFLARAAVAARSNIGTILAAAALRRRRAPRGFSAPSRA